MKLSESDENIVYHSAREKFLGLSLESTRKSYYPQLQKQLEIARNNERRLELLLDNLPALISYVDGQERYVFVNSEYEKIFGLRRDQIIGETLETIMGHENYINLKPHIDDVLSGKHVRFETQFVVQSGKTQWVEVIYVPDINSQGEVIGFYVLNLDLTEKKRAQEERLNLEGKLIQAQKLRAIGTLAGGIAHDFNNLLMGIQGRSSLMSVDMEPSDPNLEHLHAVDEYIKSATHLTRQLLAFARGGKYEVKPININDLVFNSATMFGRTRKEINIHTQLEQSSVVVEADQRQIEQILLNMYVNAWQAMPDGGDLYLRTATVSLNDADCRPHDMEPGRYARVSVTDTGTGMHESIRTQIFDPFFTTKEKGRGTGLGLASSYGIARNHGGIITVYSEVGQGSTFNIYLPLSEGEVSEAVSTEESLMKGSETILLVDDEEMILDVGQAMLERLGYRIIAANGGEEALETISKRGDEIELVILDLVMPGMDGGKVFDRIRTIEPEMPILLSSGYAINGQADKIMKRGCNGFIQKPFTIFELSHQVRKVLDGIREEL